MPMTNSAMTPLGTAMPAFTLPDVVSGRTFSSNAIDPGKPVLVLFICAHCPFTRHIGPAVRNLSRLYRDRVNLVAISANDITQVPEDSPDGLKRPAQGLEWGHPFCYDESQDVARAFGAACSPECFLYDTSRKLVYRGEIDESRPGGAIKSLFAKEPTGAPVRAAVDALLNGGRIDPNQRPGIGCNIKWRAVAQPVAGRM
jgi:thiol-disulfide isomerase/thioredoxin